MEQLGQFQDKVSKLRQLLKVATLKILEERSALPANLEGKPRPQTPPTHCVSSYRHDSSRVFRSVVTGTAEGEGGDEWAEARVWVLQAKGPVSFKS